METRTPIRKQAVVGVRGHHGRNGKEGAKRRDISEEVSKWEAK